MATTIRDIQAAVAARYGVAAAELAANRSGRGRDAVPRQLVCWLAKRMTPYPMTRIGFHFGGRNHKTVASAIARIDALMAADPALSRTATEIEEALA